MSEQVFMSDAIIEQGTSGVWSYRKWASGKKECWASQTVSISGSWGTWGNCYYKRLEPIGDYPFEFTKAPNLQVTVSQQGSDAWAYVRGSANYNTTKHPAEVGLMRSTTTSSSMTVDIYYHAIGE